MTKSTDDPHPDEKIKRTVFLHALLVRRYECEEMQDLSTYELDEPPVFGFTAFAIGVEDQKGADQFKVLVASTAYLAQRYPGQAATFLRHIMLASDYNINEAVALMTKYVSSPEQTLGRNWPRK
jgi:hypothetical protein